jgi:hypothetical protein
MENILRISRNDWLYRDMFPQCRPCQVIFPHVPDLDAAIESFFSYHLYLVSGFVLDDGGNGSPSFPCGVPFVSLLLMTYPLQLAAIRGRSI